MRNLKIKLLTVITSCSLISPVHLNAGQVQHSTTYHHGHLAACLATGSLITGAIGYLWYQSKESTWETKLQRLKTEHAQKTNALKTTIATQKTSIIDITKTRDKLIGDKNQLSEKIEKTTEEILALKPQLTNANRKIEELSQQYNLHIILLSIKYKEQNEELTTQHESQMQQQNQLILTLQKDTEQSKQVHDSTVQKLTTQLKEEQNATQKAKTTADKYYREQNRLNTQVIELTEKNKRLTSKLQAYGRVLCGDQQRMAYEHMKLQDKP